MQHKVERPIRLTAPNQRVASHYSADTRKSEQLLPVLVPPVGQQHRIAWRRSRTARAKTRNGGFEVLRRDIVCRHAQGHFAEDNAAYCKIALLSTVGSAVSIPPYDLILGSEREQGRR